MSPPGYGSSNLGKTKGEDHLSEGRVAVGVGPGFSPFEFGGFGVPVDERHTRFVEGFEVVRRALAEPEIMFEGKRLAIHPRPYTRPHPPFYWASSSDESLRKAGAEGMPILFGREPVVEVAERLARYRAFRAEADVSDDAIDREIGEMYVLRRICVAATVPRSITRPCVRDRPPFKDNYPIWKSNETAPSHPP